MTTLYNQSELLPRGKIISGKINATERGSINTIGQTLGLPTILKEYKARAEGILLMPHALGSKEQGLFS